MASLAEMVRRGEATAEPEAEPVSLRALVESGQATAEEAPGRLEAFGRGAAQGATLGFGEELGAGWKANIEDWKRALSGDVSGAAASQVQGLKDVLGLGEGPTLASLVTGKAPEGGEWIQRYRRERDIERAANEAARQAHAGYYGAGQVAGSLPLAVAVPGSGLRGAIGAGAALGAASGLGTSEADLARGEYGRAAADVLTGGAEGALGGAAGYGVAKVAAPAASRAVAGTRDALSRALESFAKKRAVKAAGFIQSNLARKTPEQIQKLGEDLLSEQVVRFGSGAEATLRRAQQMLKQRGQEIGAALEEVDKAGVPFDMNPLWQRIDDEIISVLRGNPPLKRRAKLVLDAIKDLRTAERKGLSGFSKMHELRATLDPDFFRGEPNAVKNLGKKLRSIIEDEIEDQMTAAPGLIGVAKPGDVASVVARGPREAYETAKAPYGSLKEAVKAGTKNVQRQTGNRWLSLTDYLAAFVRNPISSGVAVSSGAMLGGIPGAIGGALVHKFLRERGASMLAIAAKNLSKAAAKPGTISKAVRILADNPEALGRFGPMLMLAASEGDRQLAALHAVAEKDPEYRAALEAVE